MSDDRTFAARFQAAYGAVDDLLREFRELAAVSPADAEAAGLAALLPRLGVDEATRAPVVDAAVAFRERVQGQVGELANLFGRTLERARLAVDRQANNVPGLVATQGVTCVIWKSPIGTVAVMPWRALPAEHEIRRQLSEAQAFRFGLAGERVLILGPTWTLPTDNDTRPRPWYPNSLVLSLTRSAESARFAEEERVRASGR